MTMEIEEKYIEDIENTISLMMKAAKRLGMEPSRPAKYHNDFWQGYESAKSVLEEYFLLAVNSQNQTMIHQSIELAKFMREAFVMFGHIGKISKILVKQEEQPSSQNR